MRNPGIVSVALVLVAAAGCASSSSEDAPADTVTARAVLAAPVIDGSLDDAAWRDAAWRLVPLKGETGPSGVQVAAVVHGGTLHMAFRWADATEDRLHKPWVRKPDGTYAAGPDLEDVLAVGWPISGEFTADMESPVECVWDVWHWKAGRTDPAGFATDKHHVHTWTKPAGRSHPVKFPDGRELHIVRPEDEGTSATRSLKAPADGAESAPASQAVAPTGSAADVRARGVWRDGEWTVEIARALDTGHADDAPLARGRATPFGIAILDHAVDEAHAVSPKLTLVVE